MPASQQMSEHSANSFRDPLSYNICADGDIHYVCYLQHQVLLPPMQALKLDGVRSVE